MVDPDEGSTRRFLSAPIQVGRGELPSLRAAPGFCLGAAVNELIGIGGTHAPLFAAVDAARASPAGPRRRRGPESPARGPTML